MTDLRENEKIVRIVRQHRSVMAGAVIRSLLLASIALFTLLRSDLNKVSYSGEIVAGVVMFATLVILYNIYIWRKNTLIITNQRIIINEKQGVLSQTVTELLYKDIHDISFKQVGLSALMHRYGKLIIRMPSGNEITFDKLPSPAGIVETINKIRATS